jgi:hypothetical protein
MGMPKDKLRKADLLTSILIFLFGLWVVAMAFQMPMKDSFGGVMNVWYVSPALFPLFTGFALMILAVVIFKTALSAVGVKEAKAALRRLFEKEEEKKGLSGKAYRFVAIVFLLLFLVYMNIPRVDFMLSSLLFLFVFISMFYFDDTGLLKKLLGFYLIGSLFFVVYFISGLDRALAPAFQYITDTLSVLFILAYGVYAWRLVRSDPVLKRKYRISLLVSLSVPLILGPIFKYFLLVPLPCEGAVVALMDTIRYAVF